MTKRFFLILISFSILIALIWYANPTKFIGIVSNANLLYVFLAFLISTISLCFRVLKWSVLVHVPFHELLCVQLFGLALSNLTPGKIGEPVKAVVLKMKSKIPVSSSLSSIIWERISDLVILIILSIGAILVLSFTTEFYVLGVLSIGVFIGLILILLIMMYSKIIGYKIFSFVKKFPILNKISESFIETFYNTKVGKKSILLAFFITPIPWILDGLAFYFAFLSLGIVINPLLIVSMMSLAVLISVATSLPGGLGSFEAVMIVFLGLFGIETSLATAGIFLARFTTIWYSFLWGGVSFIYLNRTGLDVKNIFK